MITKATSLTFDSVLKIILVLFIPIVTGLGLLVGSWDGEAFFPLFHLFLKQTAYFKIQLWPFPTHASALIKVKSNAAA